MIQDDISVSSYEVKFFLHPNKVLNADHELVQDLGNAFQTSKYKQMAIQFMDTDDRTIYSEGWILRNRKKEGQTAYELTYKKRYPVNNNDIGSILRQASLDGFDPKSDKFEVEVDWGLTKKTLNFAYEIETGLPGANMDLTTLQQLFINNAPPQYTNWKQAGWGLEQIKRAQILGPVSAKKYKGEWNAMKTDIEIWSICDSKESIVEISFELKDEATVVQQRNKLKDFLRMKAWLLENDFSKTQWAMEKCQSLLCCK